MSVPVTEQTRWALEETGELHLGSVTYLSDEGVHLGKRFTGAMLGVYAVGCTARFERLTYREGADT